MSRHLVAFQAETEMLFFNFWSWCILQQVAMYDTCMCTSAVGSCMDARSKETIELRGMKSVNLRPPLSLLDRSKNMIF